ncbi:MAG: nicotinate-nucleotide adenylyltransferase [Chthoniobacterales bacterium]
MKIGIYGGTFDPIHYGHLILARDAQEALGLDKIVFFPAKISPHKEATRPASPEVRYEMVAAAIEGEAGFEVNDFEIRRDSPSYTVDTLRMMKAQHPESELFLFLGADNLAELHTWSEIDTVRELARLIVFGRSSISTGDYFFLPRQIDISSTEIRNRVAKGLSIRYLVPAKACLVLEKQKLYR